MKEPPTAPINWGIMPELRKIYPHKLTDLGRWSMYLLHRPIIQHGMDARTTNICRTDWLNREIEKLKI